MTDFTLLGLPGKLSISRTAWYKPTEDHQEKPDPDFLEISFQDFPPSHSLVLLRQISLLPAVRTTVSLNLLST